MSDTLYVRVNDEMFVSPSRMDVQHLASGKPLLWLDIEFLAYFRTVRLLLSAGF